MRYEYEVQKLYKEGDKITVSFYDVSHNMKPLKTNQDGKVYTVYKKNGRLGIDYNTTNQDDAFLSLTAFSTENGGVILRKVV